MCMRLASTSRFLLVLLSSVRVVDLSFDKLGSVMSHPLNNCRRRILPGMVDPSRVWCIAIFIACMSFLILSTAPVFFDLTVRELEKSDLATVMHV